MAKLPPWSFGQYYDCDTAHPIFPIDGLVAALRKLIERATELGKGENRRSEIQSIFIRTKWNIS